MGFQGRTNKLVDGCYTFWQAAPCVLLQRLYSTNDHDVHGSSHISEGTNEEHHAHDEDDLEDSDDDDDSDEDNDEDSVNGHRIHHTSTYINRRMQLVFDSLGLQRYVLLCSKVSPEQNIQSS
jgi:protein farnesyltransferase subunit beta